MRRFLVLLLLLPLSAIAALIDRGDSTLDTSSGLEWLDATKTAGLSYSQVVAGSGGWLTSGWRYATGAELNTLVVNATGATMNPSLSESTALPAVETRALIQQLGSTLDALYLALYGQTYEEFLNSTGSYGVYHYYTYGLLADDAVVNGETGKRLGLIFYYINNNNGDRYILSTPHYSMKSIDVSDYEFGSFLVRDASSISEPASLVLSLLGLTTLAAFRWGGMQAT